MKRILAVLLLLAGSALVQINYTPMPIPDYQFFDQNGVPLAGGFVFTYAAGTPVVTAYVSVGVARRGLQLCFSTLRVNSAS